ncbi:hypothetical protein NKH18_23840 [Streptomyces sp. M10(2022)]
MPGVNLAVFVGGEDDAGGTRTPRTGCFSPGGTSSVSRRAATGKPSPPSTPLLRLRPVLMTARPNCPPRPAVEPADTVTRKLR